LLDITGFLGGGLIISIIGDLMSFHTDDGNKRPEKLLDL